MRAVGRAALTLAIALAWSQPAPAQSGGLPALGADPARVSVSGLSSGAFMAVQYGVAFSSETMGVGVVAGGPFDCAEVTPFGSAACMQGSPSGAKSYEAAQRLAASGEIDPLTNLKTQRIYLFRGFWDPVVDREVMDAVRDFYALAGAPSALVQYVTTVKAGHGFVSRSSTEACVATRLPFVVGCEVGGAKYDQPKEILTQIYGPLQPKADTLSATPEAFDQSEFAPAAGMAAEGYVYVPAACGARGARCAVHIVFHGCWQSAVLTQDAVYGQLGYNEWADSNRVIMLYPQVDPSWAPPNPIGCWDWWGYTGSKFPTRSGAQLTAVRAMAHRLLAAPPP